MKTFKDLLLGVRQKSEETLDEAWKPTYKDAAEWTKHAKNTNPDYHFNLSQKHEDKQWKHVDSEQTAHELLQSLKGLDKNSPLHKAKAIAQKAQTYHKSMIAYHKMWADKHGNYGMKLSKAAGEH